MLDKYRVSDAGEMARYEGLKIFVRKNIEIALYTVEATNIIGIWT